MVFACRCRIEQPEDRMEVGGGAWHLHANAYGSFRGPLTGKVTGSIER